MKHILIVEDNTSLQNVYKEVLTQEGYEVTTVVDGPSCLQTLRTTSIDLILLDIMLPGGMNGFDILMRLKQKSEFSSIPTIVLSNLDSEKQACLDSGAIDYFVKSSMDVAALVSKIKAYFQSSKPKP
jgi:DNA-binding response OmpR family regulator